MDPGKPGEKHSAVAIIFVLIYVLVQPFRTITGLHKF